MQAYMRRNHDFDAWYLSGIVQRGLGGYAEAARMLRQAVKLNHDHSDARYNLGFALSRMDHFAEARTEDLVRMPPSPLTFERSELMVYAAKMH